MRTRHYAVLLESDPEGQAYAVTVPSLPGCFTQGATVPEALERVREAISGHVAALIETGQDVPAEAFHPLLTVVDVVEADAVEDQNRVAKPVAPL